MYYCTCLCNLPDLTINDNIRHSKFSQFKSRNPPFKLNSTFEVDSFHSKIIWLIIHLPPFSHKMDTKTYNSCPRTFFLNFSCLYRCSGSTNCQKIIYQKLNFTLLAFFVQIPISVLVC